MMIGGSNGRRRYYTGVAFPPPVRTLRYQLEPEPEQEPEPQTQGRMADDDCEVICLSSDDEVEAQPEPEKKQITGMRDCLRQIKSFTSQNKKIVPVTYSIPCGSSTVNGHNKTQIKTKTETPEMVTLDDEDSQEDEDQEYELEYARDILEREDGGYPSGSGGVVIDGDDDDEDIQFISEIENSAPKPEVRVQLKSHQYDPAELNGVGAFGNGLGHAIEEEEDANEDAETDIILGDGDDEEEDVELTQEDWSLRTRAALNDLVTEIRGRSSAFDGATPKAIDKLVKKLDSAYEVTRHVSIPAQKRLIEEIKHTKRTIMITGRLWCTMKTLVDIMSQNKAEELALQTPEAKKAARDKELKELTKKYEMQLLKIQKKIRKLEETDVDWDDENEHNSPYLMEDRLKKRIITLYYKLCDLMKCTHLTGRPIQCRVNIKKHASSGYDEIDSAVSTFLNKQGYLMCTPDFTEVFDIVKEVNSKENLGIDEDSAFKLAKQMFHQIMNIIKLRRIKDFKMTMLCHLPSRRNIRPGDEDVDDFVDQVDVDDSVIEEADPAKSDPILKAKLEENDKSRKSETEVLDMFAKLHQERKRKSLEERGEGKGGEDEEEDLTEETDEEDEEDEDEAEASQSQADLDLTAHQFEELTEDEDEERETVRCPSSPIDNDNENEKLTTDCDESEVEANASVGLIGIVEESEENSSDENKSEDLPAPPEPETSLEGKFEMESSKRKNEDEPETETDIDLCPPSKKVKMTDSNSTAGILEVEQDENSNLPTSQSQSQVEGQKSE